VPAKKYAYCNFCERLTEWIKDEDGWRCTGCGGIRSTEPPWIRKDAPSKRLRNGV